MTTIKDVARVAGVSYSTVSVAIGNRGSAHPLAEATRKKVLAAAWKLGYRRNALADQIRTGRTQVLSFAAHYVNQEYVFRVFSEAVKTAEELGYVCKLHALPDWLPNQDKAAYHASIRACMDRMLEARPEGVILCGDTPAVAYLRENCDRLNIPSSSVESSAAVRNCFDCFVSSDMTGAGVLAADYLAGHGHRKIGFVCEPMTEKNYVWQRFEGFTAGLATHGIRFPERYLLQSGLPYTADDQTIPKALEKLAADHDMPTAFFCLGDYLALRLSISLLERGFSVPADVSVLGYGDFVFSRFMIPGLTSISQHFEEMGAVMVRTLVERIRAKRRDPLMLNIASSVMERGSVRDLNSGK